MSGKTIATIYFYLVSAASLALIVIGVFHTVNFVINSTQYEKYPLRWGPEVDCETEGYYRYGPIPEKITPATPSAKELEKQKELCVKQQEEERVRHKVDDIKNAATFTLIGVILFAIHFPLARRQSSA